MLLRIGAHNDASAYEPTGRQLLTVDEKFAHIRTRG
jgi:hypothetical protein